MQPSHFNQDFSLQTHLRGTSDPAPFDHAKHMAVMSQMRWNKIDKQKTVIANQTQLNQSNTQLHGPGHLKAAIEQNGMPACYHQSTQRRMMRTNGKLIQNAISCWQRNPALACYLWCNLSLPVFTFSLGVASTVAQCHLCATC